MTAGINANNAGSIVFYKKFGFTNVGTFKQVDYKFNKWLDVKFM